MAISQEGSTTLKLSPQPVSLTFVHKSIPTLLTIPTEVQLHVFNNLGSVSSVCARLTCKTLYAIKSPHAKCIPLHTCEYFASCRPYRAELHHLLREWMLAAGWVWGGRYGLKSKFITLRQAAAEKEKVEDVLSEIQKMKQEQGRLNDEYEAISTELRLLQTADTDHLYQDILVERSLNLCRQMPVIAREFVNLDEKLREHQNLEQRERADEYIICLLKLNSTEVQEQAITTTC